MIDIKQQPGAPRTSAAPELHKAGCFFSNLTFLTLASSTLVFFMCDGVDVRPVRRLYVYSIFAHPSCSHFETVEGEEYF